MFGNCKCGKPNVGNYYGGSPGMCSGCIDKYQKKQIEKAFKKQNEHLLKKAKQEAERLGISLSEAILLLK